MNKMTPAQYRQRLIDIVEGGGHTIFDSKLVASVADIPSEAAIAAWFAETGTGAMPIRTNSCVAILRRVDGIETKVIITCNGDDAPSDYEFQNVVYSFVRFLRTGTAFYQQ